MSAATSAGRTITPLLMSCSAVLLLTAVGCEERRGGQGENTSPRTVQKARGKLSPVVAARMDSGNAAYREGDYERALEHYRQAAEYQGEAESPGPWFGIFMVHRARSDTAAADSALARVRELSSDAPLVHPEPGDTAPPDTAGG